jgi:hypothetical protein
VKPDPPARPLRRRTGEKTHRLDQGGQLLVVCSDASVEFGQFGGDGLVIDDQLTQMDEGPDNDDAHFDGRFRVEHGGNHKGSVFCKRPRQGSSAAVGILWGDGWARSGSPGCRWFFWIGA